MAGLGALALAFPAGKDTSPNAARVFGKTFALDANDLGLKSVTLASEAGRVTARFRDVKSEHAISAGFGQWQRGEILSPPKRENFLR